jgi:hypothetical protein
MGSTNGYPSDYYAAYANYYGSYGYSSYGQEQQTTERPETANAGPAKETPPSTTSAPTGDPYYSSYYSYSGQAEAASEESIPLNYDYRQYTLSPEINGETEEIRSYDHT